MKILSCFILLQILGSSSALGSVYNPLGIPSYYPPPMYPPLYNPGPGNLPPSFSYTAQTNVSQQPATAQQSTSSNLLTQDARNVIAKWRQLVVSSRDNPNKITDTDKNIAADQSVLDIALSTPGLTSDELNNIGQIKVLLDLALVRWLNDQVSKATKSFPKARAAALQGKTSKIDSVWYIAKRNQLGALLERFQQFLNKSPQYAQNPPSLLVGMLETLIQGQKSLTKYQQFCNCFDNPELQYCAELGATTTKNQSETDQSNNGWGQRDENGEWVGEDY